MAKTGADVKRAIYDQFMLRRQLIEKLDQRALKLVGLEDWDPALSDKVVNTVIEYRLGKLSVLMGLLTEECEKSGVMEFGPPNDPHLQIHEGRLLGPAEEKWLTEACEEMENIRADLLG